MKPTVAAIVTIGVLLLWLCFWGSLIWVACHFIVKFW
jgi:hypothetical protein